MSKLEGMANDQMTKRSLVMLSEAKHLKLFSHSDVTEAKDQRLKAWPRGLHPLRCSFASLRLTVLRLVDSFVIRLPRPSLAKAGHSCFVIFLTIAVSTALAEKRPITDKDLWDFVWIGDPQVSPDGARVAFVRVTVNEKKEGYNTSIWSVPLAGGEASRQLTKGDHATTPRWSPNGKFLLFLRSTEKNGKPE